MRTIVIALSLLVVGVAGAGLAVHTFRCPFSGCCSPAGDCCYEGSPCCSPDCCQPGSPCCQSGACPCCPPECCPAKAKDADCCAAGEECCKPASACCEGGQKD